MPHVPQPPIAAVICFVVIALTGQAQTTRQVPQQYATIQSAIVAAAAGDVVLVAPGNYVETISFLGKAITVKASQGAAVTTIDGNQAGPVISFAFGEGPSSVLDGFTITNGRGPDGVQSTGSAQLSNGKAGGIDCDQTSPTIKNCVVSGNTGGRGGSLTNGAALSAGRAGPGGIRSRLGAPTIIGTTIAQNLGGLPFPATTAGSVIVAGSGGAGGLLIDQASPVIKNCIFDQNVGRDGATGGTQPGAGGAGAIRADSPQTTITGTLFRQNHGGAGGTITGAPQSATNMGSGGAGAVVTNGTAAFVNCIFDRNTGGDAGGLSAPTPAGVTPGRGGAGSIDAIGTPFMFVQVPTISIENCTFAQNIGGQGFLVAETGGGALSAQLLVNVGIVNTIVWANLGGSAVAGGQGIGSFQAAPGSQAPTIVAANSDIQGGWSGQLVQNTDPLFVNAAIGDYRLSYGSPCTNTGTNAATLLPATDIEGGPRIVDGITDIGADEMSPVGLIGSNQDFRLETTIANQGDPLLQSKRGGAGDTLSMAFRSAMGTFNGSIPLYYAQVYIGGFPPASPGLLSDVHINPASGAFLVYDGTMVPGGLPSTGTAFVFAIPPGLAGFVARFQAFAVSPLAQNGIYAATDAHDIVLY